MKKVVATLSILALFGVSYGQYISEFEPNPAGSDPAETSIEIGGGTPGASFDLWILSVENDGYNGLVDRFSNVTGTYDDSGMAVVVVPDLENPSFTLVLTTSFTGDNSTDLDPADNGVLDTSSLGDILDAIGVSDNASDDPGMYGALMGGSDVLYNGQFEPLLVFRDSITGELYNTVTVDFGLATEHVGVFDASGSGIELDAEIFDIDPLVPTFGSVNPTTVTYYINEFEPNPAGSDPADTSVEIAGGIPGVAFDLWLLSVENDGFNGLVDRFSNITGTFDDNGLAVVTVPDFENPSFTLVLTTSFTGDNSTDLDPADDGVLDTSSLGFVLDAIGVSDALGDDATMYGALMGGSDVLFNGQFEPLLVFRDSVTGELYNTVTVDFGGPTEHVGVFDASGSGIELDAGIFDIDPLVPTFGLINPTVVGGPIWAGYEIGAEGYAQTAPWLGLLYVNDTPWVWSVGLGKFLFIDELGVDENGGWVFFPKPAN